MWRKLLTFFDEKKKKPTKKLISQKQTRISQLCSNRLSEMIKFLTVERNQIESTLLLLAYFSFEL